jgi:hypothetical protein
MARTPWKRSAKLAVKAVVAVVVLWAVGRHVGRSWADLRAHGGLPRVEPVWFVAGGVLYLAGLAACGVFYGAILRASATPVGTPAALRAYLISHLGKYVPGKAMVVVMRVGLSSPYGARPATAAFATFYETLVMMAAGSALAAVAFATGPRPVQLWALALAAGLTVAFLVVVDPAVFPRAWGLASTPFKGVDPGSRPRLTRGLLAEGLLWTLAGWLFLGLSQAAVVRAVDPAGVAPGLWLYVAGAVAFATVAGFVVAVLPGGLGVREGVLMTTLAPAVRDQNTAAIAALALRLTWVAAEVAAALALAAVRPARPEPAPAPEPEPEAAALAAPPEPRPGPEEGCEVRMADDG